MHQRDRRTDRQTDTGRQQRPRLHIASRGKMFYCFNWLISPSVVNLENLIHLCERELNWSDMAINYKKSCFLRIGPRYDISSAKIISLNGHVLPWTNVIRYLGIFIVQSRAFKCSIDEAKRSFYRAANAIFGKIGRLASEEVTLHLLKTKCIPIFYMDLRFFN